MTTIAQPEHETMEAGTTLVVTEDHAEYDALGSVLAEPLNAEELAGVLEANDYLPPRPRNTLRELAYEATIIDAVLEARGGELTPELEARLDAVNAALLRKTDGVRDYLYALDADVSVLKAEEKRLADRRRSLEGRLARFERHVLSVMQRANMTDLAGQFGVVKRKLNPPSVEIVDAALVPSQYRTETTVVTIDKNAIKSALKAKKSDELTVLETYSVPAFAPEVRAEVIVMPTEDGSERTALHLVEVESGDLLRVWASEDVVEYGASPDSTDTQFTVVYRKVAARLTRVESLAW